MVSEFCFPVLKKLTQNAKTMIIMMAAVSKIDKGNNVYK